MAEFPALPLWTDSYLADTRHLSTLEHGAYLLLLMEAWRRPSCSLPDDDRLLARLAGLSIEEWDSIKILIMGFWRFDGRSKTWTQKKLSKERTYVSDKSAKQRERIAKRWNKTEKDDTAVLPDGYRIDTPTPTPTPTLKKEPPTESLKKKSTPRQELSRVLDHQRTDAVLEHRQRMKKPLTSYAASLLAKQLELSPDPNGAADHMIGNGWQGFKPEWLERSSRAQAPPAKRTIFDALDDDAKREMEARNGTTIDLPAIRR